MTYTITLYVLDDPISVGIIMSIGGVLLFKILYKLIELIPGM